MPAFASRLFPPIRDARDLRRHVVRTTILCVSLALSCDIANQLIFFEGWTEAFRSWLITMAIVVVITAPVSRALGKAHLALYRAGRLDPLTGLLNRRALFDDADEAPRQMALVIVDIDKFKQVNDTYGHLSGDNVLRAIATMMSTCLGDLGRLGRLGGEEFALFTTEHTSDVLLDRLEAFRDRIAATPVMVGTTSIPITISAGLANRRPGQKLDELYVCADRALYVAKASGRNRIVTEDEIGPALAIDRRGRRNRDTGLPPLQASA